MESLEEPLKAIQEQISKMPGRNCQGIKREINGGIPEAISEGMSQKFQNGFSISKGIFEKMPEAAPDEIPKGISLEINERLAAGNPGDISHVTCNRIPGRKNPQKNLGRNSKQKPR